MATSQLQPFDAHGARHCGQPAHRRVFIGPMPEKVLSQTEAQVRKKKKRGWFNRSTPLPDDGDGPDDLSNIIEEHAFQFFLGQGGNEEDWGDNEAESVRKEMLRRWGESEWGSEWKRRKAEKHTPANRWVGGSFEIGNFLGVNIIDQEPTGGSSRHSAFSKGPSSSIRPNSSAESGPSTSRIHQAGLPSNVAGNSLVTAPSKLNPSAVIPLHSTASVAGPSSIIPPTDSHDTESRSPVSNLSTAALLAGPSQPAIAPRRSKMVHYADRPATEGLPPAPPTEVLARTGTAVEDTSAGATAPHEMTWGDVVMRGALPLLPPCLT